MENVDKKENECEGCKGACQSGSCFGSKFMCGHGCHGGKRHLVRMILKLIIVIIIFWCGFKLGEISGSIRAEYGHKTFERGDFGMMRGGNYGYFQNPSDVNGGVETPAPVTTTPAPVK